MANIQKSFIDALTQNQAAIAKQQAKQEARHQESIKALQKEVRTLKTLTSGSQNQIPAQEAANTPPTDKIKMTESRPSSTGVNPILIR